MMIKESVTTTLSAFPKKQNPCRNARIQILYHKLRIFETLNYDQSEEYRCRG